MTLSDIIRRSASPCDWDRWSKIPWHDPAFSERMLENHLSQEHDWASRTNAVIEEQVLFIHGRLSGGASILDLGCGPGLYTEKLWALGHPCTGVDFSPASIDYARRLPGGRHIEYVPADIRNFHTEEKFDAVLLLFGEINAFSREEALSILRTARKSLCADGKLFVEAHTAEAVREVGRLPSVWQAYERGLFSEKPHLCLEEHFWNEALSAAVTRYYILDAESAVCSEYASFMQAYREEEYEALFRKAGFLVTERAAEHSWPVGKDFSGKMRCWICSLG